MSSLPPLKCTYVTEDCIREWKNGNSSFKGPTTPVPVLRFLYELSWTMLEGNCRFKNVNQRWHPLNFWIKFLVRRLVPFLLILCPNWLKIGSGLNGSATVIPNSPQLGQSFGSVTTSSILNHRTFSPMPPLQLSQNSKNVTITPTSTRTLFSPMPSVEVRSAATRFGDVIFTSQRSSDAPYGNFGYMPSAKDSSQIPDAPF